MNLLAPIAGYEGRYAVTEDGRVFSYISDKYLSPGMTKMGYLTVALRKEGASHSKYVHRLVAEAYVEKGENFKTVNHKDGRRDNNHYSNLEWVSYSDNHVHAYRELGRKRPKGRAVAQFKNGVQVGTYPSLSHAARVMGCAKQAIWQACNGIAPSASGFEWGYL